MTSPAAVLTLQAVRHSYRRGGRRVPVLDGVDLTVGQGERVAVLGSSGGGKSTLLQVASGVLRPDEGQVVLLGHDLMTLRPHRRASLRLAAVAHVHQDFRLLPMLSARDNVAVVARLQGVPAAQARARAEEALREVGLARRAEHLPGELSGGEQQRVAIARAVLSPPRLLLADEPTGALDAGLREGGAGDHAQGRARCRAAGDPRRGSRRPDRPCGRAGRGTAGKLRPELLRLTRVLAPPSTSLRGAAGRSHGLAGLARLRGACASYLQVFGPLMRRPR